MERKEEKRGRPKMYEAAFTRKICEEFFETGMSIPELAKKYNVSYGGVYRWIHLYEAAQKELLSSVAMETPLPKGLADENKERTEENVQEALRLTRLKIIVLETLIDMAEQRFKIDIRKKSGTKPPVA